MNQQVELKQAVIVSAAAAVALRKTEVSYRNKLRKYKKRNPLNNSPYFSEGREQAYANRMKLRKDTRELHLARAFISGVPLSVLEGPTTRTAPSLIGVTQWLKEVNADFTYLEVEEWLSYGTA